MKEWVNIGRVKQGLITFFAYCYLNQVRAFDGQVKKSNSVN